MNRCLRECRITTADQLTKELPAGWSLYHVLYRVRQNKISQHENFYVSVMPEYFCTKFRSSAFGIILCINVLLCAVLT